MKSGYVIQSTNEWDTKDGRHIVSKSYYQKTSFVVFPMNHMTGNIEEAKFYEKKNLANKDLKRYFIGKREQIIPYTKQLSK